ncbi:MAG: UDP-N-acetylmuramoyl-tripeptide--D-alanyl-D-alanine ligase [Candidatus Omnitrophica bacterium]|nr:UDP-N-acetylmuramoyl-tripeptide--D-alanyl-D-alanine ligase [Candidatus Omnitrophota bacterium]
METDLRQLALELPGRGVSTDTRTLKQGDIFFALKGPRFDGHDFIEEAVAKGAWRVVFSDSKKIHSKFEKSAGFLKVRDTLKAYGELAKVYRGQFKIPVVAVTGSVGKTTVKELLAHLLKKKLNVLKNEGTENNLVGVPKTILRLRRGHEVLVLEMGTNRPGEIGRLSRMASPTLAILTRVGHSHLEGLNNLEGVREEKLGILKGLAAGGIFIVNGEDPSLKEIKSARHRILRVSFSDRYPMRLIGRDNRLNGLLAAAAATELGIDEGTVREGLGSFEPVKGRLEEKEIAGIHFINDTYNSNPVSFKAALEALQSLETRGKKGVVCGDMLELGGQAGALHRRMGLLLAEFLFDFVIAAGPLSAALVDEAVKNGFDSSRIRHVKNAEDAGALCREWASAGDRVLVKGSRGMKMEKVFECFITSFTR